MSRFSKLLDAFESYSANLDAQTERALSVQQKLNAIGEDIQRHGDALKNIRDQLADHRAAVAAIDAELAAIESQKL
jgi:septal ring factor EnvC (AmiA/AmiB activator)